jgi:hypothetical protein
MFKGKRTRDKAFVIQMTEAERNLIHEAADACGGNSQGWARALLLAQAAVVIGNSRIADAQRAERKSIARELLDER